MRQDTFGAFILMGVQYNINLSSSLFFSFSSQSEDFVLNIPLSFPYVFEDRLNTTRNDLRICVLFYCCPCAFKLEQLILAIFQITRTMFQVLFYVNNQASMLFFSSLYTHTHTVDATKSNIQMGIFECLDSYNHLFTLIFSFLQFMKLMVEELIPIKHFF